jgi:hypothetical protein
MWKPQEHGSLIHAATRGERVYCPLKRGVNASPVVGSGEVKQATRNEPFLHGRFVRLGTIDTSAIAPALPTP